MAEIVELIAADHLHIMRWQVRLAELRYRPGEPGDVPALAATWNTLASLIGLHMAADEEICGPVLYGTGPAGLELIREVRDAHEDLREIIHEVGRYPIGSPRWWDLATAALAAWTRCLRREVYGPLADCRRRASPALRARLARQWRAYMDAQIRGQYRDPPPWVPTCQLRQTRPAATVPRLADPAFAPLACVCPACTLELDPVPDAGVPAQDAHRGPRKTAPSAQAGGPAHEGYMTDAARTRRIRPVGRAGERAQREVERLVEGGLQVMQDDAFAQGPGAYVDGVGAE